MNHIVTSRPLTKLARDDDNDLITDDHVVTWIEAEMKVLEIRVAVMVAYKQTLWQDYDFSTGTANNTDRLLILYFIYYCTN